MDDDTLVVVVVERLQFPGCTIKLVQSMMYQIEKIQLLESLSVSRIALCLHVDFVQSACRNVYTRILLVYSRNLTTSHSYSSTLILTAT
jgi:hypothetical protein